MEVCEEYKKAVTHFNSDVYPAINRAHAFLSIMPNILQDIAREYGEDSYAVRRIREGWTEEVGKTLSDAMKLLEEKERKAVRAKYYDNFKWAVKDAVVCFFYNGSPIEVVIDYIGSDDYPIHIRDILYGRVWAIPESDLGVRLFKTEDDMYNTFFQPDHKIWAIIKGRIRTGNVTNMAQISNEKKIQVLINGIEGSMLFGLNEIGKSLFYNSESIANYILRKDVLYFRWLLDKKHGTITEVNSNSSDLTLVVKFDDGSTGTFPGLSAFGNYLFFDKE